MAYRWLDTSGHRRRGLRGVGRDGQPPARHDGGDALQQRGDKGNGKPCARWRSSPGAWLLRAIAHVLVSQASGMSANMAANPWKPSVMPWRPWAKGQSGLRAWALALADHVEGQRSAEDQPVIRARAANPNRHEGRFRDGRHRGDSKKLTRKEFIAGVTAETSQADNAAEDCGTAPRIFSDTWFQLKANIGISPGWGGTVSFLQGRSRRGDGGRPRHVELRQTRRDMEFTGSCPRCFRQGGSCSDPGRT